MGHILSAIPIIYIYIYVCVRNAYYNILPSNKMLTGVSKVKKSGALRVSSDKV